MVAARETMLQELLEGRSSIRCLSTNGRTLGVTTTAMLWDDFIYIAEARIGYRPMTHFIGSLVLCAEAERWPGRCPGLPRR